MSLVVQKFGGSSVATAERIMRAARRAIRAKQAGNQVIVVVSARATRRMNSFLWHRDQRASAGPRNGHAAVDRRTDLDRAHGHGHPGPGRKGDQLHRRQIGIVTDSIYTKARIKNISTQRMQQALEEGNVVIVAGFQGIDENYNITTLGRGGSDTTAVALAAVMKRGARGEDKETRRQGDKEKERSLREVGCEIYTDVDGIYSTDPRIVPEARKMDFISYDEMLELASVGAGVMHSRSIEFAKKFDVPLQVRSSFTDTEGTWIVPEADWMREVAVCGAAIVKDEARINITDVPDQPGISHRVFSAIAEQNIVVDMIVQNVGSAGRANIGFTVLKDELPATLAVLGPLASSLGAKIEHQEEMSKVSIVGTGMRTHTGVAQRLFAALADAGVSMKMITTGDIKISVLVDKSNGTKALRAVHQAFQLDKPRAGAGLPGGGVPSTFQPRVPAIDEDAPGRDLASITERLSSMEDILVSDIWLDTNQGRVTVLNLPDRPDHCSRIFQAVADAGIVVDMIVQNAAAPGRAELSFSVPRNDLDRTLERTRAIAAAIDPAVQVAGDPNIARLFVLGVGMRTHTGVARRMFGALAQRNINIGMINTSEVCISVVVDRPHGNEALVALKETFHVP